MIAFESMSISTENEDSNFQNKSGSKKSVGFKNAIDDDQI
jgi:hypothetical protein